MASTYARKKLAWRKDKPYLAWVASLPCIVCRTRKQIEVAHIGERAFGQKCPPRETAPLCRTHHRIGPEALHQLGKNFWAFHGIDRNAVIEELNRRYESRIAA